VNPCDEHVEAAVLGVDALHEGGDRHGLHVIDIGAGPPRAVPARAGTAAA
jgi:hypothetical protein